MPGPRSTTRSSTRSPCALAVISGGLPGGAVAQRVLDEVDQDAFQQRRVGVHVGQRRRASSTVTSPAERAQVVERAGDDLVEAERRGTQRSAPACSRLMSSRFSTRSGEPVQRLVGGGEQLVAVGGVQPTSALPQAGDRRLGRGERRAQVVARPRRAARCASGRPRRSAAASPPRSASRCWSRATAACAANAPSTRRSRRGQRPPAQRERERVADRHVDVAVARCGARVVARRGHDGASRVVGPRPAGALEQRSPTRSPNVSRSWSSSAASGPAPRSTLPATWTASRPRRWPGRPAWYAARRGRPRQLTTSADDDEHDRARAAFSASAIGELVDRRREVVVQQQRRRPIAAPSSAGTKPPISATATTTSEEEQDVAGAG